MALISAIGCASTQNGSGSTGMDGGAEVVADSIDAVTEVEPADTSGDTVHEVAEFDSDVEAETDSAPAPGDPAHISCGYYDCCALTYDGHVRCWGDNTLGAVGDGTKTTRYAPTPPIAGLPHIVQISVGQTVACALAAGGQVYCWGEGTMGLAGDGIVPGPDAITVPVAIPGIADATQVGAGSGFACVLRSDKTVWCWGRDDFGQLGRTATDHWDGVSQDVASGTPTVVPGLSDIAQISFGQSHSCALTQSSSTVYCWGNGDAGELGDGTLPRSRPDAEPVPALKDVIEVAAGNEATVARTSDGSVYFWGRQDWPTYLTIYASPIVVSGFSKDVVQLSVEVGAILARRSDGHVECAHGALPGTCDDAPAVIPGIDDALDVTVSRIDGASCVVGSKTGLRCWGKRPGDGTPGPTTKLTSVLW